MYRTLPLASLPRLMSVMIALCESFGIELAKGAARERLIREGLPGEGRGPVDDDPGHLRLRGQGAEERDTAGESGLGKNGCEMLSHVPLLARQAPAFGAALRRHVRGSMATPPPDEGFPRKGANRPSPGPVAGPLLRGAVRPIKERRVGCGAGTPAEEGNVQLNRALNERIADLLRRLAAYPAFAGVNPSTRGA